MSQNIYFLATVCHTCFNQVVQNILYPAVPNQAVLVFVGSVIKVENVLAGLGVFSITVRKVNLYGVSGGISVHAGGVA